MDVRRSGRVGSTGLLRESRTDGPRSFTAGEPLTDGGDALVYYGSDGSTASVTGGVERGEPVNLVELCWGSATEVRLAISKIPDPDDALSLFRGIVGDLESGRDPETIFRKRRMSLYQSR